MNAPVNRDDQYMPLQQWNDRLCSQAQASRIIRDSKNKNRAS